MDTPSVPAGDRPARLPDPVAGTDAADTCWARADDVLTGRLGLAFDHQRIVADGVERARRKLENSALATAFCGPTFTISELQRVYEAVWGIPFDPRNFYPRFRAPATSTSPPTTPEGQAPGAPPASSAPVPARSSPRP